MLLILMSVTRLRQLSQTDRQTDRQLLSVTCLSYQYRKGYHSNVRTEVADTEAIPLFTTTIHTPAKLPQVQLCRHASIKNVPIPALMTNSIPGKTAMNVAGRTAAHEDQALCILSIYVHLPSWFECKPKSTPLCTFCFPSMENKRSALVATNLFILWLKSSSCTPDLSI